MSIDVSDGHYRPPLRRRAPDQAPELPADAADALAREQAEEDAVFLASSRARLAADQSRALRDGAARARETGGAGFAADFIDGYRAQAEEIAAKAASAGGGQARPSDEAVAAFRAGAAADADALIDRAAMAETLARAERRQRESSAALDAVSQGAFDDPDGYEAAQVRLDEMAGPLAPILNPEAPDKVRRDARATLAESAARGRIASSPRAAIRELDDPARFGDLPPDRRAELRQAAERRQAAVERDRSLAARLDLERDVLRRAEADRDFATGFLARARSGEAQEVELEDAVARGVITLDRAGALREAHHAENGRRAAHAEGLATLQDLIDSGLRPDPRDPIHLDSVASYWKHVLLPALRQQRPQDLPNFIAAVARNIGFVPQGAGRAVRAFWDSGDPERRIAAARTVQDGSVDGDPEQQAALVGLFDARDLALQGKALEFVDVGLPPKEALERAEAVVPVEPKILSAENGGPPASQSPLPPKGSLPVQVAPTAAEGSEGTFVSDGNQEMAEPTTAAPNEQSPPVPSVLVADEQFGNGHVHANVSAPDRAGNGAAGGPGVGAASGSHTEMGATDEADASGQEPPVSSANPWEAPFVSDERRRNIDQLFDEILESSREDLPEIEERIKRQFADSPDFAVVLVNMTRSAIGSPEGPLREAARDWVQRTQRSIASGMDFNPERTRTRATFVKLEKTTDYQFRPAHNGRIRLSAKSGSGTPVTISERAAKALATGVEADDPRYNLFLKFATGTGDPKELDELARKHLRKFNTSPSSVALASSPGAMMVPGIAKHVIDETGLEAFTQAQKALQNESDPEKRSAIVAAVVPAIFPEVIRDPDAVVELVLDLLPIVGEIRSAVAAVDSFDGMVRALKEGNLEAAVESGVLTVFNSLGAIPVGGVLFRPARAALRAVVKRTPVVGKAYSGRFLHRALKRDPSKLKGDNIETVLASIWDDLPKDRQRLLKGLLSNIKGQAGELEMVEHLRRAGFPVHTTGKGRQGDVRVTVNGERRIFDQVTEAKVADFWGIFVFPKRGGRGHAIDVKIDGATKTPRQKRIDDLINSGNAGRVVTESLRHPIEIELVRTLNAPIHEVSEHYIVNTTRRMLRARIRDENEIETIVEVVRKWHEMSRNETITVAQMLAALAAGVGVRAAASPVPDEHPEVPASEGKLVTP